ncbi:MAG: spermidine synthase [Acidobacteriota bacterium]
MLLSAALLFVVQPMFAKMILPRLGGSPATWNTCLVFFQIALLLGYTYAHIVSTRVGRHAQVYVHLTLLAVTLFMLPIRLHGGSPPTGTSPVWWLLGALTMSVGLPFVTVAATAPLLQRWFALVSGRDPYFLYAASNAGSLVGLLGYPIVVERTLRLADQSTSWFVAFGCLAALLAACAWTVVASGPGNRPTSPTPPLDGSAGTRPITRRDKATWLVLAFVPSSLLLGVTTHLSTDVVAVPLLWVIPLALYLLTFVAAFASPPPVSRVWTSRLAPLLMVGAIVSLVLNRTSWWWLGLHLLTFATVALVCHRELAERRPPSGDVTRFYLWVSLGGALGGVFTALVAPFVFTTVVEYPLALAAAAFLRPSPRWWPARREHPALLLGLPIGMFVVIVGSWAMGLGGGVPLEGLTIAFWLVVAVPWALTTRVAPFAAAITVVAIANASWPVQHRGRELFVDRSFFGVVRVVEDTPAASRKLLHGTTVHGWQGLTDPRCTPTGYYARAGPIGQLFAAYGERASAVAVIGLGAGGLVCYGGPADRWTFYEIDPLVERVARDPALFTYLRDARAEVRVVIGDGRLTLAEASSASYDLVVVDAFSSDAIPAHLLTREFMAMTFARLKPAGLLAFHISNRYFDLEGVLAASARDLGASVIEQRRDDDQADEASRWLVIAPSADALATLAADPRWRVGRAASASWTDDFSNILDVIAWSWSAPS